MDASLPLPPLSDVAAAADTLGLRTRYAAKHATLAGLGVALLRATAPPQTPIDPAEARTVGPAMWRRLMDLFAADLRDAEDGLYPRSLALSFPWRTYLPRTLSLLANGTRIRRRRRSGAWRDLPDEVDLSAFPPYFRRTFHWQTDGYLSRRSAALYDPGVEMLFLGAADVMRRRVLRPIVTDVRRRALVHPRILDVACGTGRTLAMLARALPGARLTGLDLSPYYVAEARRQLTHLDALSMVVGAAEDMPWRDGRFDVVTSTYLFHELPRRVRREAMAELARVVVPGGRVVVEDSAQLVESEAIRPVLEAFPQDFHEPYYRDYLDDPLEDVMGEVGLQVEHLGVGFLSKIVVARRPR